MSDTYRPLTPDDARGRTFGVAQDHASKCRWPMSDPMTADKMLPTYTDEQGSYLAHEVSHDLRAGLPDRERWNNRCVGMLLNEIERLRAEVSRLAGELGLSRVTVVGLRADRDRLAAENERLRSEITLLRQEIDEVRYKDTAEVDDLAAIGRLAVLIHDQTEDAIARDAAMEIQNIVRGVEP